MALDCQIGIQNSDTYLKFEYISTICIPLYTYILSAADHEDLRYWNYRSAGLRPYYWITTLYHPLGVQSEISITYDEFYQAASSIITWPMCTDVVVSRKNPHHIKTLRDSVRLVNIDKIDVFKILRWLINFQSVKNVTDTIKSIKHIDIPIVLDSLSVQTFESLSKVFFKWKRKKFLERKIFDTALYYNWKALKNFFEFS